MENLKILNGKKVLIVDDEPDVLASLKDLLDMCQLDFARYFEDAEELLNKNRYDIAVFDIMGVGGYQLLGIAKQKGIPALMFTAHALSPDDLVRSIEGGANAYIPKEKMADIASYLSDLLADIEKGRRHRSWFTKLRAFFNRQFGSGWMEKRQEFMNKYDWLYPNE
jgi:CheY-like chemotaxis protein